MKLELPLLITTERQGGRVLATAGDASAEAPWREDLDETTNHLRAARALRRHLGIQAGLHGRNGPTPAIHRWWLGTPP